MGGKHLGASRVPRTTSEVMLLLLGDAQGTGVGGEGEAEVNRAVMTVVLRPCLPPGPDLHNVLQRESFPAERKSRSVLETHCKAWRCPGRGPRPLCSAALGTQAADPARPTCQAPTLSAEPPSSPRQSARQGGVRGKSSQPFSAPGAGMGGVYKHWGNPVSRPGVSGPGDWGSTGLTLALLLSLGPSPPHLDSGSIKLEEDRLLDSWRP